MDVCIHNTFLNVRTCFSETHDLVQTFCIGSDSSDVNNPIEFHVSGLQRKGHQDIWHVDVLLSYATDEVAPICVNDDFIGANHGYRCAVKVTMDGHARTCADIGTCWRDDTDLTWVLIRVIDADTLLFISENIGVSEIEFQFADTITGQLRPVDYSENTINILIEHQVGEVQLTPAISHSQRQVYYWKNHKQYKVTQYHNDCDKVEIIEEYTCYNPATVARALCEKRPKNGYVTEPHLAVGEPMFRYNVCYSILKNGMVLCDFQYTFLQEVYAIKILGIMHQEKADPFGGGVWRYIPKLNQITDENAYCYDFSQPVDTTNGPFPYNLPLTPDTWSNPDSPPDRQIDIMHRPNGTKAVAFATGYLPIYDGEPSKRANNIMEAGMLVHTRKTYPTFFSRHPNMLTHAKTMQGTQKYNYLSVHGVGYKVYYKLTENSSHYVVEYKGMKYHYFDFWDDMAMEFHILLPNVVMRVQEQQGNVKWTYENDILHVIGAKGYLTLTET